MRSILIAAVVRFVSLAVTLTAPITRTAFADALDNWTTNQVSTNYFGLNYVAYGNGCYVAYGSYSDYGVILSSEDGRTWVLRSNGGGPSGNGLSYALALRFTGGRFFALGGFGAPGVSTDGVNWTIFSFSTTFPFTAWGVVRGGSRYVAVGMRDDSGSSDLNIFTSTDSITWTAWHSTSPNGARLGDVAYAPGLFVALGADYGYNSIDDSGHTYTSTAGITWTQRTIPPGGRFISYINGNFIVPYAPGTNLISSDGINWVAINTGITDKLGKVSFANGLFIARSGLTLATSTNGTNWVQYPQAVPGGDFATDGSRLVTVSGRYKGGQLIYDGFVFLSDVLVGIQMKNSTSPEIALSGLVGRTYRVEYADTLAVAGTNYWQPLISLQLPTSPYLLTDATAANSPQRFYRGVLLP